MKKKKSNKLAYLGIAGLTLILAAFFLVGSLRDSSSDVTGHSVNVRYYGVSGRLMENKAGNLQTYLKLEQPTLMNMGDAQEGKEVRSKVAADIISSIDLAKGITDLYQAHSPTSIRHNSLEKVSAAAGSAVTNFKEDTTCLKNIGENHGHIRMLEIFMVSELKFQRCVEDSSQYFAYLKHTFFNKEGNRFICSQESGRLFLVRITDGEINADTSAC